MSIRRWNLSSFNNVGASQTAVLSNIQQGETFLGIALEMGGTFDASHVSEIRLNLGGKRILEITGTHLDTLNQYMGKTKDADYLTIWFAEREARTVNGEYIGALDTSVGYSSFSMEVDIGAATSPTLKGYAITDTRPKTGKTKNVFRSLLKSTHTPGGAAVHNLDIPLGSQNGNLFKRLFVFHTNLSTFGMKRDSEEILAPAASLAVDQFIQNETTRVNQSGLFVADPVMFDNQSDAIPTSRGNGQRANWEFNAETSAADTLTCYSDIYTELSRL